MPIVTRALAYLDRCRASTPTPTRRPFHDHDEISRKQKRGLTRTRQKFRHRYTITPACSSSPDHSRESVRTTSREQDRTDSRKRFSTVAGWRIWILRGRVRQLRLGRDGE